jgi:hypothetical protein
VCTKHAPDRRRQRQQQQWRQHQQQQRQHWRQQKGCSSTISSLLFIWKVHKAAMYISAEVRELDPTVVRMVSLVCMSMQAGFKSSKQQATYTTATSTTHRQRAVHVRSCATCP